MQSSNYTADLGDNNRNYEARQHGYVLHTQSNQQYDINCPDLTIFESIKNFTVALAKAMINNCTLNRQQSNYNDQVRSDRHV